MARIIERTEASGVGADDYVLLCSPTLGERKFKAIDLVPSGGNNNIIQTPRYQLYHEHYVDVVLNYDNSIDISWDDGVYVGCSLNGIMDLSNNGFTKLKYDITFGSKCYDSDVGQNIRPFIIGVTDQIHNQYVYASQSDASTYFQAYDLYDVNYLNQNVVGEVDISEVTGSFYLLVVATGWNVTINSIELE